MWNDLCAEQMKYRHTFLGKAFLVAPLLTFLLGIKLSPAYVVLTSFNWWYMFLLPAMLSIVSCSCGEKDRKLGEKAVFTLPVSLKRVRLIKIFYCSLWLFLACIVQCILTFVAGQVFQAKYSDTITIFHALFAGVLLFLTYAWQIPLCLLLEQKCGTVATILINMVANIILSANFATERMWLIPYAVPARLMCPVLKILPNGLPAEPGNITFSPQLLSWESILPGLVVTCLCFVLVTEISIRVYERKGMK